jgi:hypothetical protein
VRKMRLPAKRSTIDRSPFARRLVPFSTIRQIIAIYRSVDNPGTSRGLLRASKA